MNKTFSIKDIFIKKTVKGVPKLEENLTENQDGYHVFGQNIKYQYPQKVLMDEKYLQVVEPNRPILAYTSSVGEIGIITESFYRTGNNGAFQGLFPKREISLKAMLYILTCLKKQFDLFGYTTGMANVINLTISLPVIESSDPDHEYTIDDIDLQYMQDRIAELEQDRIAELETYLVASGLDNYGLTEEDKELLSLSAKRASDEDGAVEADCEHEWIRFKKFKIASSYIMRGKLVEVDECGIFNIFPTKEKIDANKIHFGGTHPYVARGSSNNGIRGYIDYDEKALNPANTISFGQDTATMYYQPEPYFTGDKIQVFELNKRYGVLTENEALYLVRVMSKAFENFFWGQQSFAVDVIANIEINLPINSNNEIDFNYIERYIRVIEKLAIADVVRYKNQVIATTKQVVVRQ